METTTYYYDPNGNQIASNMETVSDGTGSEVLSLSAGVAGCEINRYNGFNQLVESDVDSIIVQYEYYPSGLRLSKTTDETGTAYILDGDQVVLERTSGTVTAI